MGKPEGNSDSWLVTYSDMVTLLLVFFVLIYTLTPGVEMQAFTSFIAYFQKDTGFFEDAAMAQRTFQQQTDADDEEMSEIIEENMERWMAFADFLEEHELISEVDIKLMSDGVKITLSDSLTFESGSSELLPQAREVLSKLSATLTDKVVEIEVQGHTDNVPLAKSSYHKSNWHLGAARAVTVVQYLQDNSELDPERFKASSFGEYKPVAENDTPEGRLKNRRVEIYFRDKINTETETPTIIQAGFN